MRGLSRGTPARAGIGLRAPHVDEILVTRPGLGCFVVTVAWQDGDRHGQYTGLAESERGLCRDS